MQEDVTERRRDEERIRKLINFDALTGLPNRTMFASRFSQALALTQRSGHQLALLYLDLDHFNLNPAVAAMRRADSRALAGTYAVLAHSPYG